MEKKRCSKCKEVKPLSYFYRNKNMKSGYMNQCAKCFLGKSSDWQDVDTARKAEMKEKQDEYARKYCKEHPIENWDEEMLVYLYRYLKYPKEWWDKRGYTICHFANDMQQHSSYNECRKAMKMTDVLEKEEKLIDALERYRFNKAEQEFLENERKKEEKDQ